MEELFERYKNERDKVYFKILTAAFFLAAAFTIAVMISACILYKSARPVALLSVVAIEAVVYVIFRTVTKTKNNRDEYFHNGGLFFESFATFIEEEIKK